MSELNNLVEYIRGWQSRASDEPRDENEGADFLSGYDDCEADIQDLLGN